MIEIITESEYKNIQHLLPLKINTKYYINTKLNSNYNNYYNDNIHYLIILKLDKDSCYFDQFDKNHNYLLHNTFFTFGGGGFEFWIKPKERLIPKTRFSILR